MVFLILGIVGGMLVPMQTLTNGKLNTHTNNLIHSIYISFGIGVVFLFILNAIINPKILIDLISLRLSMNVKWLFGGLLGVLYLMGNLFLLNKIGSSLTVIFTLLGQLFMGLIIDSFGLFSMEKLPFTLLKFFAVVFFLIGCLLINSKKKAVKKDIKEELKWLFIAILFGFCPAIQNVINNSVGRAVGSFFISSLISFIVGFCILMICVLLKREKISFTIINENNHTLKVMDFFGGILGVSFVTINLIAVSYIGAATVAILGFLGQILMALIIEHFGLFTVDKCHISFKVSLGVLFFILGMIFLKI